jgi:hypothetical protein
MTTYPNAFQNKNTAYMKTDKQHPQESNFPNQKTPLRLLVEQGPREKQKNERPEAGRIETLFYDRPIYKAQKYLLF